MLRIAVAADCDFKTVERHLKGMPTRARVTERIKRALEAEGVAAKETAPSGDSKAL